MLQAELPDGSRSAYDRAALVATLPWYTDAELAGVGYDLTNVGNQLTLQASAVSGNQIIVHLIRLDANGNNGVVANFNGTQPYQFTLVQTAGGIVGYTPGKFTVNTAGFTNDTQGGAFSVVQQGNNLVLVFVPVPEPGTWALLCIVGMIGLGAAVRRQVAQRFLW